MTEAKETFEGWAVLELMGHRKLAGYVREQVVAGAAMVRIDVPGPKGESITATQFYSPAAVYCITPVTEELARKVAVSYQPAPVSRYDLPQLPERSAPVRDEPGYSPFEDEG